jgi:hypothetical protein
MKQVITFFVFFLTIFAVNAQVERNSLHGKILDSDKNILPGASVIIVGTKFGVNANEAGEYLLDQIPKGLLKVQVSFVGYKAVIIDFDVQPGQNTLDVILDFSDIKLEGVTVTSQKREQQVLDVPITLSVINARFMADNNITELDELSQYVPGLQIRMQTRLHLDFSQAIIPICFLNPGMSKKSILQTLPLPGVVD